MKKFYFSIIILLAISSAIAQSPEMMSYQAVVRNSSDDLVVNSQIGMEISILKGSTSGPIVYQETQTPTSNENGLVSIQIGGSAAVIVNGDFSTINWSNDTYFIQVKSDPTGGTNYTITGTNQLLSVPYALHAKSAETLTTPIDEVDGSITNEIQDLLLNGNFLTITNNSSATVIDLSVYDDADGSSTNEIQDLQLDGDILTITNNSTATEIDLTKYYAGTPDSVSLTAGEGIEISGSYPDFIVSQTPKHYVGELIGTNGEDGVVFWVDHTGEHGLICSPEDLNGGAIVGWSDVIAVVPDGALSRIYGSENTIAINTQSTNSAATICLEYSTPGTSVGDWYLPAVDEMSKLYHTRYEVTKALNSETFGLDTYWTSTELSSNSAWFYNLGLGFGNNQNKNNSCMVRAIREF